jgi:GNAT superfamily N-acetyltransferase
MHIAFRFCREEDLPLLEWFGAFTDHRAIIRGAFALQQRGQALMLVADANGFPVGQAWVDLRPRASSRGPLVWAVRVLDPFQGLGIGRQLMTVVEDVLQQDGYACIELGVEKGNPGARQFYEKLGWRVVGDKHVSYSYVTPLGASVTVRTDEWVLAKELSEHARGVAAHL